jgi:hypothetical protein
VDTGVSYVDNCGFKWFVWGFIFVLATLFSSLGWGFYHSAHELKIWEQGCLSDGGTPKLLYATGELCIRKGLIIRTFDR